MASEREVEKKKRENKIWKRLHTLKLNSYETANYGVKRTKWEPEMLSSSPKTLSEFG